MKCPNFEKCGTELTEMATGCKRCLKCNPMTKYVAPVKKARRDVDLPWTDERVIEVIDRVVPDMIRETLENWHIQKPSVTRDDIKFLNNDKVSIEVKPDTLGEQYVQGILTEQDKLKEKVEVVQEPTQTWRQQAKELGIEVYDRVNKKPRLKVDVIKEIAEKQKGKKDGESESEGKEEDWACSA